MSTTNPARNQNPLEVISGHVQNISTAFTPNKDAVIVRIAEVLSESHRRSSSDDWGSRIRWRETFCTTGIGRHFALLHDFQCPNEVVETVSADADVWFFLLPEGVDWNALDEEPVHVIACPVFAFGGRSAEYLSVLSTIHRAWTKVTAEENIALARLAAADAITRINAILAGTVAS